LTAARPISIGSDAIQANHQRVSRKRAFDKEWPGQGVAAHRSANRILIAASCVNTPGLDDVAGKYSQRWRDVPRKHPVAFCWSKCMGASPAGSNRRSVGVPLKFEVAPNPVPLELPVLYFPIIGRIDSPVLGE